MKSAKHLDRCGLLQSSSSFQLAESWCRGGPLAAERCTGRRYCAVGRDGFVEDFKGRWLPQSSAADFEASYATEEDRKRRAGISLWRRSEWKETACKAKSLPCGIRLPQCGRRTKWRRRFWPRGNLPCIHATIALTPIRSLHDQDQDLGLETTIEMLVLTYFLVSLPAQLM